MSSAEYKKTTVGNETQFDVVPAAAPFPIGGAILFGIVFGGMTLILFSVNAGGASLLPVIFAAVMIFLKWKGGKAGNFRWPAKFTVSAAGITTPHRKIATDDIHRLILRNHYTGGEVAAGVGGANVVVAVPVTMANATGQIAAQVGRAYDNHMANISYRLEADAGGKATTLACGMDETTAYGLMTDVGRILGLH